MSNLHSITLPSGRVVKVRTCFDYLPIPDRSHDWLAYDDATYDVDGDSEGYRSRSTVGEGRTEREAIADFVDQSS
jgi:hypothetical protein